jgi:hypothetical protein
MEEQPPRDHDPKSSSMNPRAPPSSRILLDEGFFSPKKGAGKSKRRVKEGLTNFFFNATKKVV